MFGGMMDPELMRLAQEQMSRMRPEDLQKMQEQMMSNPSLMRMASEGMKNLKPEDLRTAAEQMKNIPPEQMADISSRMANASPEEIASMRARTEALRSYEYQSALRLKSAGNQLHGNGRYAEAAEKYLQAKSNSQGILTSESKSLQRACSLNLMSCYLKTEQYQEVIAEGTEILKGEPQNLKALYRRGQAYRALKDFKHAVSDLRRAAELSPEDETVADLLSQARVELSEFISSGGPIIEEITDEDTERPPPRRRRNRVDSSSSLRNSQIPTTSGPERSALPNDSPTAESLNALSQDPEMIRTMHSTMSTMNPEHLAAMSGGGLSPEMAKMAADIVKNMSPEELGKMVGMAQQFGLPDAGLLQPQANSPGVDRQISGLERGPPSSTDLAAGMESELRPENLSTLQNTAQVPRPNSGEGLPSMADFSPEMQQKVRKQMEDPAMKQMMLSMAKSMTPETMASMSEQFGYKMTPEEAVQAQKAMSNFNPDDLDRMLRWVDFAQRMTTKAKNAKNWFLRRPGLILAVAMLLIAVILHWLGYIG